MVSRNGKHLLIVLIIFLGFTSPLSTDMCLPALSTIASDFAVARSSANLIIIAFFLFTALCTLIAGPLSDRFGRKKVMIASIAIYAVGNLICASSPSIVALVAARAIAACGAGGMLNSSTALTKDAFTGRSRDVTLSIVQVFQIVAPLVAPVLGALLLTSISWRATFALLVVIGLAELALASVQPETQPEEERGASTIGGTFAELFRILGNRAFTVALIAIGCLQACFMAYLATSSYVYQVGFHVSATAYSFFFSSSALISMLGPLFRMKVLYGHLGEKDSYRLAQAGVLVGGICVLVVGLLFGAGSLAPLGPLAPVPFWAAFLIVQFSNSVARPVGVSILLKQHATNAGALSALINFGLYIIGLVGMVAGSLDWSNYLLALGGIIVCISLVSILCFAIASRPGFGLVFSDTEKS